MSAAARGASVGRPIRISFSVRMRNRTALSWKRRSVPGRRSSREPYAGRFRSGHRMTLSILSSCGIFKRGLGRRSVPRQTGNLISTGRPSNSSRRFSPRLGRRRSSPRHWKTPRRGRTSGATKRQISRLVALIAILPHGQPSYRATASVRSRHLLPGGSYESQSSRPSRSRRSV